MDGDRFFLQIEKNPKKKFFDLKRDRAQLDSKDYEVAADALMKNAEQYRLFIWRASNRDLYQVLDVFCPFLSNCGLACELFLKALLCFEKTDYITKLRGKDRHSLYRLYELLKIDTKKEIIDMYPYRNSTKEKFEQCLQENSQTFFELRYSTEYIRFGGNAYFIPDLMMVLYNVAASRKLGRN